MIQTGIGHRPDFPFLFLLKVKHGQMPVLLVHGGDWGGVHVGTLANVYLSDGTIMHCIK